MAASFFETLQGGIPAGPPPSAETVAWLHSQAGTNADDLHHELGAGAQQAARGDHTHNGVDSVALWPNADIPANVSGTDATSTTLNAVLALLRRKSSST